VFGKDAYPDLDGKAAALFHSVARNRALIDGNKRLALTAVIAFYGLNTLVPYAPVAHAAENYTSQGDTPLANDEADARLWPEILSFLADPSAHTGEFTAAATPPPLSPNT
jgi:prophage maintenance system killer protein